MRKVSAGTVVHRELPAALLRYIEFAGPRSFSMRDLYDSWVVDNAATTTT
jgi:hypothetical protein